MKEKASIVWQKTVLFSKEKWALAKEWTVNKWQDLQAMRGRSLGSSASHEEAPTVDVSTLSPADLEELKRQARKDADMASLENLFFSAGLIFLCLGLAIEVTNFFTLLLALGVIGWRQMAFLDLQKRSLNGQLFSEEKFNQEIGRWGCAYPLFTNLEDHETIYETYSENPQITQRPRKERLLISGAGLVGLQRLAAIVSINLGIGQITEKGELKLIPRQEINPREVFENFKDNYARVVLTQLALLLLFSLLGMASAYVLWVAAYITVFSLLFELRREKRSPQVELADETSASGEASATGRDKILIDDGESSEDLAALSREEELFIPNDVPVLREPSVGSDNSPEEDLILNTPPLQPSEEKSNEPPIAAVAASITAPITPPVIPSGGEEPQPLQ